MRNGQVVFGRGPFLNFEIDGYVLEGDYYKIDGERGIGKTVSVTEGATRAILCIEWINYNNWLDEISVIRIDENIAREVYSFNTLDYMDGAGRGSRIIKNIWINEETICIRLVGWDKQGEGVVVFTNPIWIERIPREPPKLQVSPTILSASLQQYTGPTFIIGTVSIANPGGGTLHWQVSNAVLKCPAGVPLTKRLRVSPDSGKLIAEGKTTAIVEVLNAPYLTHGTYTGTVTFTGGDMRNMAMTTKAVNVTLTVPPPQLHVSPTTINASVSYVRGVA